METKDWITAIIAAYGAFVSTYLAVMRVRSEKKKLTMRLEYKVFSKRGFLTVANSGHRPITIRRIIVGIPCETNNGEINDYYGAPISPKLPNLISDGEIIVYEVGKELIEKIEDFRNRHRTDDVRCKSDISVLDGEQNGHNKIATWGWSPD